MTTTQDTHLEMELSHVVEGAAVIAGFGMVVGALLAAGLFKVIVVGTVLGLLSYTLIKK